jgi:hypothetical protein
MNLAKRSKVPENYLSSNSVSSIEDLRQLIGYTLTVLLYDTGIDMEIVACEKLVNLSYYASEAGVFARSSDESKFILIRAEVIDPNVLPFELSTGQEAFVIYDNWDFGRFISAFSAGKNIEQTFNTYAEADIDKDFLVMIGREMPKRVLELVLKQIDHFLEDQV